MNRRSLASLLLPFFAAACSAPKTARRAPLADPALRAEPVSDADWEKLRTPRPKGEALAFRFVDFRTQRRLGLLNESHTDPAAFYSRKRTVADSLTKVGHDDVVAGLLERFEEHGWFDLAKAGPAPAPAAGSGPWTAALELERPSGRTHLLLGTAASAREREVFTLCRNDFATLYNSVLGLQAVERPPDWNTQQPAGIPPKH